MADLSLAIRHAVVSLRARDVALVRAAQALGVGALPAANRWIECAPGSCLWVRPDEWLIIGDHSARLAICTALEEAVGRDGGAIVDISASRLVFELSGAGARDVLASCCPLDLHTRAFAEGRCAQSLIGKAPVLLQLMDDAPRWRIVVRPSLFAYVTSWLTDAMAGA